MKKLSMALAVIICAMLLLTGCDVAGATGGLINFENIANNLEGIGELLEGLGDISSLIEGIGNNQSSEYPTTGENDWETAYGTEESFVPDEQTWPSRPDRPQRPESPTESGTVDILDPDAPELNGSDYGGRSLLMLSSSEDNGWVALDEGKSVVDSSVFARNVTIGEQLNVVMEVAFVYGSSSLDRALVDNALTNWKAGMPYDLVIGYTAAIQTLALQGAMDNWNNSSVDVDREWWYQDAKDQFTAGGGGLYSLAGDGSHVILENALVTYVNANYYQMLGFDLDSLYDDVDRGAWSYELLNQYSQKANADSDANGAFNVGDRVGYYMTRIGANAIISGVGEHLFIKDNSWSFNSYATAGLANAVDYANSAGWTYIDDSSARNEFMNGNVLFLTERLAYAEDLQTIGMNFGILPTPAWGGSDYASLVTVSAPVIGYCRDIENVDLVSDVVDLWGYYGNKGIMPTYSFVTAQSSRDSDMIEIVRSSLFFDHDFLMARSGNMYSAISNLIIKGSNSLSATIAANETKCRTEIRNWSDALDKMSY